MFSVFKQAVASQFATMKGQKLFVTDVDKDKMWELYLESFPDGSNPIFRERREYDCQCCRQFIRSTGNVVAISSGGELISIWDVSVQYPFQPVADALSQYVKAAAVKGIFLTKESSHGTDKSYTEETVWEHFFLAMPPGAVMKGDMIGVLRSQARANFDVTKRSMEEITLDSVDTVIDQIESNALYRGEEHKALLYSFADALRQYDGSDAYCWTHNHPIRNTVIGTLLTDISDGKPLEEAVASFESKVAPANYKRPTALITKSMIKAAEAKVKELGFEDALQRRYAKLDDITINNVIYANRNTKQVMGVFEDLAASVKESAPSNPTDLSIDDFLTNVLPRSQEVEAYVEKRHEANKVALIAPVNPGAPSMFKWDNNFSWTYTGDVADSIRERVKKAGGSVTGDLRVSLSWYNGDDLDLHLDTPAGVVYYNNRSIGGYLLDVDMNAGRIDSLTPVENITHANRHRMQRGIYTAHVNQFIKRHSDDYGFEVEFEFCGKTHRFVYDKPMKQKERVEVVRFEYNGTELRIIESLPESSTARSWEPVSAIMLSPNHWDDNHAGNKHWFFMLEGYKQEGSARGFYNEFLCDSLTPHRKTMEALASRLKAPASDDQLSGLGFSSTQNNNIIVKADNRVYNIIFGG